MASIIASTTTATTAEIRSNTNECRIWVHGVPDTSAVWQSVLDILNNNNDNDDNDDTSSIDVALNLPGFGSPAQVDISTSQNYLDWLIEIVDETKRSNECTSTYLIGHDFGGIFSWGLINQQSDLVDNWMIIASPIWPGYTWHILARVFRIPILGEVVAAIFTMDWVSTAALVLFYGVPIADAKVTAQNIDKTMSRHVLSLYRSTQDDIGALWWRPNQLKTDDGIFVFGSNDSFMRIQDGVDFANEIGTTVVVIEDLGHWVNLQDPEAIAKLVVVDDTR